MTRVFIPVLASILMFAVGDASAWNAVGHMTVAKIAYDELDAKHQLALYNLLKDFGQTTREDLPTERSSMVQVAQLMNHPMFKSLAKVRPGSRLERLLKAQPRKPAE